MRFVYIDTKGKEVGIPTVDALALRIELGAITETTKLYDEASDRWAPAGEHEVYRSLVREQQERSGGFVAPPPPTPVVPPPPVPQPPPPPAAAAPAPPPPAAGGDPLSGLGFDLTLEPTPGPEAPTPADPGDAGMDFGTGFGDATEEEAPPAAPPAQAEKKAEAFDFSGFGGMLADDEDDEDEEEEAPAPSPPPPAADSGLELESTLATAYGGGTEQPQAPAVTGSPLDLEQPLSDLPIDQAGWSPKDRMKIESAEEEAAGASESGAERARALDERAGRPDRSARAKPAPPPEPPKKSPVPALIAAVVALVVVGGGGWLGLSKLKNRPAVAAVDTAVVEPAVPLPPIAAELEPRMRAFADSTMADWLLAIRTTLPAEKGVPAEPDRDWLSGAYLADASKYPSIEQYWQAVGRYVDDLETRDADVFGALYQTRLDSARVALDSAGVSADDQRSMRDRAQAGFLAARPDRRPVYDQLRAVVDASLGLHEFLVANEANIDYDPAAGGASKDPVLEAVPKTPELKEDMWSRVDRITQSLDALGALDLVTTERLLGVFAGRLQAIPIR